MRSPRRTSTWAGIAGALAIAAALVSARAAQAQSVTSGAIRGVTLDTSGIPVRDASVTLTHHATGWVRTIITDGFGRFRSPALPPGRYDVRVEQLGFRPLVVLDVSVSPAAAVALSLRLVPAEPPVTQADTVAYVEGALHASLARGSWNPGTALADLADPEGRVASLASLASLSSGGLGLQGLPDRMGVVGLDGIPLPVASHPGGSSTDLSTLNEPYLSLDHAEVTSGTDAEWSGFGGGLVSAFSAQAPRAAQFRAYADGGSGGSWRGGAVLGGPLVRDTALALIGVDIRRLRTDLAAPWPSDTEAALAVAVARDSLGEDLSGYLRRQTRKTDVVTAFGRFDWQVADGQSVALRAAVTNNTSSDFALGPDRPVGLGSSLNARDISGAVRFDSRLASRLAAQVSFAVDRSLRDYGASPLPGTVIVSDALSAGSDAALPGHFERNSTRASAALLFRVGSHELKGGFQAAWTNHDIRYDPWRDGVFYFGSAADLGLGRGAFVQSVGGAPAANFSISSSGLFLQDSWTPVTDLNVLLGVRIEGESWPTTGVAPDGSWLALTGLSNAVVPRLKSQVSPRFAFTWSAAQHKWLLRGDAGVFAEGVDPWLLAEVLTHDGTAAFRRGVGTLGLGPAAPDSTAAPVTGPVLAMLNPGFQAPRTSRASLSLARNFASGTTIQVSGQYRHTVFLPRRSDLNLAAAPQYTDQFGRPVYGTLQQIGSMLVATPGSNRRFGSFDRVYAIDPSGFSDYWAATVAIERLRERGLSAWVSYTYSHTTDNTPGLAGTLPDAQLSPFPGSTGASDWRDGRSDLDVPHRLALGAELATHGVKVAALLRVRSGLPFTPGFRPGVDANGDGAASNDPAFVSDTIAGAAAVLGQWSCLSRQLGGFAARNSCRGPVIASFDMRFTWVRVFDVGGAPVSLVVDALNLVRSNDGVVDNALYLVDPSQTLTTSGTVVTVPLVANPNFGKLLQRRSPGTVLRAGLRFDF
jgi:hypothetical protein